MNSFFTALRTLVYGTLFIMLWVWIALSVRVYDHYLQTALPSWSGFAGTIVISVGAIVALLCLGTFVLRGKGTPAPFDPPQKFVAVGPYRYVRNPMYIGGGIMLFGM